MKYPRIMLYKHGLARAVALWGDEVMLIEGVIFITHNHNALSQENTHFTDFRKCHKVFVYHYINIGYYTWWMISGLQYWFKLDKLCYNFPPFLVVVISRLEWQWYLHGVIWCMLHYKRKKKKNAIFYCISFLVFLNAFLKAWRYF